MNTTKARCGHYVYAVGAPNSPARIAQETSLCSFCFNAQEKRPYLSFANVGQTITFNGYNGDEIRRSGIIEKVDKKNGKTLVILKNVMKHDEREPDGTKMVKFRSYYQNKMGRITYLA